MKKVGLAEVHGQDPRVGALALDYVWHIKCGSRQQESPLSWVPSLLCNIDDETKTKAANDDSDRRFQPSSQTYKSKRQRAVCVRSGALAGLLELSQLLQNLGEPFRRGIDTMKYRVAGSLDNTEFSRHRFVL